MSHALILCNWVGWKNRIKIAYLVVWSFGCQSTVPPICSSLIRDIDSKYMIDRQELTCFNMYDELVEFGFCEYKWGCLFSLKWFSH